MATNPKSRSVERVAATAKTADEKARNKAKAVDSFVNFAQNLGIGADNALSSGTYGFNPITRNRSLLEWIHRGSWLGGVAVDIVANDMTRMGIDIKGNIEPEDIEKLDEKAVSLHIWNELNNAIKWSRLYGGCLAVMLVDGQNPETPLRLETIKKDQFRGLLVLDRWMVEPALNDLVTEYGPDLGNPKFYRVTAQAPAMAQKRIHYSRCIRLGGIKLPYWQALMENLWGLSVIERLYDRMIAFDSATTGAAQLVYKSYMRTYKIEGLRETVAAGGDALKGLTAYVDQMRRFQGIEGITLIDAEDDITSETHAAFGGLSDALQQFAQQLSGALQIPLVRLFGQSPVGFSTGETDLRNYYDTIRQDQEKDLRVGVTKIWRAMAASEGIDFPEGTTITFRSLWQLTDEAKSTIASTVGNVISAAEEGGLIGRGTALKELKQNSMVTGIFSNITAKDIKEAEAEGPPVPEDVEVAEVRKTAPAAKAPKEAKELNEAAPKSNDRKRMRDAGCVAAGILFVTKKGEALLLMRSDAAEDSPSVWGLPGGHLEEGETPENAARRETYEETGVVYKGPLTLVDLTGGFATFLAEVDNTFEVSLNFEHSASTWAMDPNNNLHPNLERVLAKLYGNDYE